MSLNDLVIIKAYEDWATLHFLIFYDIIIKKTWSVNL